MTEAQRSDSCIVTMKLTQTFFIKTIPNIHITIRSSSGKCIESLMKTSFDKYLKINNTQRLYS